MKFTELNKEAQEVAIADYIKGWKETHPDETLSNAKARELCIDIDDDVEYNPDGKIESETYTKDELKILTKTYYETEQKIFDIVSELENFSSECDCDDCETWDMIHDGEWKEIQTFCLNCGGYVERRE